MTAPDGGVVLWSHPSVELLAQGRDPVEAVAAAARARLLEAVDAGFDPPPYDPFLLARALGVPLRPVTGGFDARTVPDPASPVGVRIEYDPGRPVGRLRFSVAHEIGHTLFPDVAEQTRHRSEQGAVETFDGPDDWQLELLCNVAAAEFLMPAQTLADLRLDALDLREVMARRKRLQVSTEALVRRLLVLTDRPAAMFAARRTASGRYTVDYAARSRVGGPEIEAGLVLPETTVLAQCTAVGYTADAVETWNPAVGAMSVQAVGIPPYPGHLLPRVAGIVVEPQPDRADGVSVVETTGDALDPPSPGTALIVHVVNDRAHAWGGGFAGKLGRRYPWAAEAFRAWTVADDDNLHLGGIHTVRGPLDEPAVCSMVAQEGFGPSLEPRLRYPALAACLDAAAEYALANGLSVHAPRIGTGQALGHWDLVRDQLDRSLARRGIPVVVYRPAGG
jgi:hypothetical protein